MLFYVTRIVLWLLASLCAGVKIKKGKSNKKKFIFLLTVIFGFLVISVSAMLPIENLFINFKTPESVFKYMSFGEVNDVIAGKDSCLIIYSDNNNSGAHRIIPKTDNGYKIPTYLSEKRISHRFDSDGCFDVYNVFGSEDCYIVGIVLTNGEGLMLVDSRGDQLKSTVIKMGNTEISTVVIYAYAEGLTEDYYWLINGKKIAFSE